MKCRIPTAIPVLVFHVTGDKRGEGEGDGAVPAVCTFTWEERR